jgi:hypothetical protein
LHKIRRKSPSRLRGGCLSKLDRDYIERILWNPSLLDDDDSLLLEKLLELKQSHPMDKLQMDTIDRRIQEILWKDWKNGTRYNKIYESLSKESQIEIAEWYCHNSKTIHIPEESFGKAETCAINAACAAEARRRLAGEPKLFVSPKTRQTKLNFPKK